MKSKVLALLALCLACGAHAADYLLPASQKIAGQSQEDWSRAWWQWAGSFEQHSSPVSDRSGAACGRKQSGAVWFLAGAYGSERTLRRCEVPRGKYLFFPLINYVVMPGSKGSLTCAQAMRSAK